VTREVYVTENKAAMCNCPRQCRHLVYNHDISQAMASNYLVAFAKAVNGFNGSLDELRNDYCLFAIGRRSCEMRYLRLIYSEKLDRACISVYSRVCGIQPRYQSGDFLQTRDELRESSETVQRNVG